MQKVIYIAVASLLAAGCASSSRSKNVVSVAEGRNVTTAESILKNNLTNNNFHIQKAEIRIISESRNENVIASLKYSMDGTYLASIRTKSGLEILRIYISNDTILANDRIHRKIYYGSGSFMKTKYGLSTELLPLVLGDFVASENTINTRIDCNVNREILLHRENGRIIRNQIDCRTGKILSTEVLEPDGNRLFTVKFEDFTKANETIYPERIEIIDSNGSMINIKLNKINFDFSDTLVFNPGAGYEKVLLK